MKRPTAEGVAWDVVKQEQMPHGYHSPYATTTETAIATAMQRAMDEFYRPLVLAARASLELHEHDERCGACRPLAAALRGVEGDDGRTRP